MRMKCSTELSLRVRRTREDEVLHRIVPGAICPLGRTRIRMKCSTELSLGHLRVRKISDENETLIVPGENSDDCLF